jgi:proline dehydrogenase
MEKERERAEKNGYPSPIHNTKADTDKDYDAASAYCIDNSATISLILASHNEQSNLLIAKEMENKGMVTNHAHVHFSQLYGMSDHITFNMSTAGYNVSKYLPFGPLQDVIPYLMRRAEENTSVNGQTSRELTLIRTELARRKAKK